MNGFIQSLAATGIGLEAQVRLIGEQAAQLSGQHLYALVDESTAALRRI